MSKEYRSPDSGNILEPTEKENIYYDPYSKKQYYLNQSGNIVGLESTINGLPLIEDNDAYLDKVTGQRFVLDEEKGIIPKFIPDDTLESAHIVGNYLVANSSGRKFPIIDGKVIVPFEPINIDPNVTKEELDAYFKDRKNKQYNRPQEEIDRMINEDMRMDKEALKKIKNKIINSNNKQIDTIFTPEEKQRIDEFNNIRSSIKGGVIPEESFNRLLDLGGFAETERKSLTDAFSAAGKIKYHKKNALNSMVNEATTHSKSTNTIGVEAMIPHKSPNTTGVTNNKKKALNSMVNEAMTQGKSTNTIGSEAMIPNKLPNTTGVTNNKKNALNSMVNEAVTQSKTTNTTGVKAMTQSKPTNTMGGTTNTLK